MLFTKFATIILLTIQTGGPAPPPPNAPGGGGGGGTNPVGLSVPLDENLWILCIVAIALVIVATRRLTKKVA
jgi:hypothetical protein